MPQWEKLLRRILDGQSDHNIDFGELRGLLKRMGFDERTEGDHHVFTKPKTPLLINIQPEKGGKAKAYQVRQIRKTFRQHGLTNVR